jgi:hypothetical protein
MHYPIRGPIWCPSVKKLLVNLSNVEEEIDEVGEGFEEESDFESGREGESRVERTGYFNTDEVESDKGPVVEEGTSVEDWTGVIEVTRGVNDGYRIS